MFASWCSNFTRLFLKGKEKKKRRRKKANLPSNAGRFKNLFILVPRSSVPMETAQGLFYFIFSFSLVLIQHLLCKAPPPPPPTPSVLS